MALGRAASAVDARGGECFLATSVASVASVATAAAPVASTVARDARDAERSTRCDCGSTFFARLATVLALLFLGLGLVPTMSPLPFLVGLYTSTSCTNASGDKRGKNQGTVGPVAAEINVHRYTPQELVYFCYDCKSDRRNDL